MGNTRHKSTWLRSFALIILSFLHLPLLADGPSCDKVPQPKYDPKTYYATTIGLTGPALKAALNERIKGHRRYVYSPCVWLMISESDQDPDDANAVIEIYTQRSIDKSRMEKNNPKDPLSWNREHVWANSHGFPHPNQHAYTDLHHLRAADKKINGHRGNRDFSNAKNNLPDDLCDGCATGPDTWQPPAAHQGDIARMLFYMATRYEGNDASSTPDLELLDIVGTKPSGKTFTTEGQLGKLCSLYAWHHSDPVSEIERVRNDVIYSWQGNRNPFIDHPEFVAAIWGNDCP